MVTEGADSVKDRLAMSMAQPMQVVEVEVARMALSERMVDTAAVVAL
jgi:hypothetical protein